MLTTAFQEANLAMADARAIVIPERGTPITAEQMLGIERELAARVVDVDSFDQLDEWRAQARALEGYLRDKELQGPMLSAQRRCEARIGQLLPDIRGRPKSGHDQTFAMIDENDRPDFRILANALNGKTCEVNDLYAAIFDRSGPYRSWGSSWVGGNEKRVPIWYWPIGLWVPLTSMWQS